MNTGFYTHDLCSCYSQGDLAPEVPERIETIEDRMLACGLNRRVQVKMCGLAEEASLLAVHTAAYLEKLKKATGLATPVKISEDTWVNKDSWSAAVKSAGAAIEAVRDVCSEKLRNAFVCVRPPGHHAGSDWGHGFCLVNSVACAAKAALDQFGLKRVAIIDIDVHRADGTEDIVRRDPRMMLLNVYQKSAFPFHAAEVDSANVVNEPLADGTDGEQILSLIESKWRALVAGFRPELILLSTGFDAHRDEQQALFKLTEFDYSRITEECMRLAHEYCGDRLVSVLEGGYNLSSLARSAVAHVATLVRPVK